METTVNECTCPAFFLPLLFLNKTIRDRGRGGWRLKKVFHYGAQGKYRYLKIQLKTNYGKKPLDSAFNHHDWCRNCLEKTSQRQNHAKAPIHWKIRSVHACEFLFIFAPGEALSSWYFFFVWSKWEQWSVNVLVSGFYPVDYNYYLKIICHYLNTP